VGARSTHCLEGRQAGLAFRDTIAVATEHGFTMATLFRVPFEGTVAEQIVKTGTGALWIDGCRIAHVTIGNGSLDKNPHLRASIKMGKNTAPTSIAMNADETKFATTHAGGRWPTNVVFVHRNKCRRPTCEPACPVTVLDLRSGGVSHCYPQFEGHDAFTAWIERLIYGENASASGSSSPT
jgi:hypothetical protein